MARGKWPMLILDMWGAALEKITLYKGKEVVKKNVSSETAVDELINLLKENEAWIEPS